MGIAVHDRAELENYIDKHGYSNVLNAINLTNKSLEDIDERILSKHTKDAIVSGKWDKQSIDEYNNFIKLIQDGKINFKRRVGEGESFTHGISEIHAGASILLRADYGAKEEKSRNKKEEHERNKGYEEKVETWAKANNLWLNDYEDPNGNKANTLEDLLNNQWTFYISSSEADVYLFDNSTLLKSIDLSHTDSNLAKALDRIALFNKLFPETALSIVGFGRDSLDNFRIIATQPFIIGTELSYDELQDFIKKTTYMK